MTGTMTLLRTGLALVFLDVVAAVPTQACCGDANRDGVVTVAAS